MIKNPIANDLNAENLTTNPAGVHQILGFLQKVEEKKDENGNVEKDENGKPLLNAFSPTKTGLYRSWKLWTDYNVVHSKTLSYMIGLGIIEKVKLPIEKDEDKNDLRDERLVLTERGWKLRDKLRSNNCKIDLNVVIGVGKEKNEDLGIEVENVSNPKDEDIRDALRKKEEIYLEVRDMFLNSPCYKVFEDFMYENCDSVLTLDSLKNLYYKELNQVYGKGSVGAVKAKSEKSENSSGNTAADNNCVSIIQWCEFFDVIKYDKNGNVIFDLDVNELVKRKIEMTKNGKKQIIFSGAPGTGKTYSLLKYADGADYKFIQFHSSYDYTDFVEGIRPAPGDGGKNLFVRMDGVFKEFCRKIVNENEKKLKLQNPEWNLDNCYEILCKKIEKDEDKKDREELLSAINKLDKHYFIIDEINRADLSKVFGELLFALEDSYRGLEHRFPTQYNNLLTYEVKDGKMELIVDDCFRKGFFIPRNLIILGSMNDIDKSVESVDFALRRRFDWCEIIANNIMTRSLVEMKKVSVESLLRSDNKRNGNNLVDRIIDMNGVIDLPENGLGREYHVGPAYFSLYNPDQNNILEVFNNRIRPLIKEYLRGRDEEDINEIITICLSKLVGDYEDDDYEDDDYEDDDE